MTTPALSAVTRPEVGRFYLVPCVKVESCAQTSWMDRNGWVPVLGPKHRDAEHLEFDWEHFHVDWRFIGTEGYRRALSIRVSALGTVLTNDGTNPWFHTLPHHPELRRIKCKRDMPTFPDSNVLSTQSTDWSGTPPATRWARLERAQAIACNKLKPGNICPHRGIALDQFAQPDGTAICPGHGLRWNLATGELMPRLAA